MIEQLYMNSLKSYSCSLKNINKTNVLANKNMAKYLKQYAISDQTQNRKVTSSFSKINTINKFKQTDIPASAPLLNSQNLSSQFQLKINKTKNQDIRSTSETRNITENSIIVPIYKKLTHYRQSRSKLQQKIDQMMNQVINQHNLPLIKKSTALNVDHKSYRNIRISTEKTQHQNNNNDRLNEETENNMTHAINLTLSFNQQQRHFKLNKIIQKHRRRKKSPKFIEASQQRILQVPKQKQLVSLFNKNIQQYQQITIPHVLDCHKYSRHFRAGKSSVRDLHLHKY